MPNGQKVLPIRCNTDIAAQFADAYTARFIKNMTVNVGATDAYGQVKEGQNQTIQKSLQSNELYVPNMALPAGDNFCIGAKGFSIVNRAYFMCYNSEGNHFIYRLNGDDRTFEMVKIDPLFNFQLNPIYFISKLGMYLDTINYIDPDTGDQEVIEDLYWTDGFNYMGYIRVDDCIATNGFSTPYFAGDYDKGILIRMGLPTPNSCISVEEIPRTDKDQGLLNNLLFNTWQFRISVVDVYGRPSEHSIISDLYIPGINDCLGSNQSLPRCLNLIFDAGNPLWNTIDIEYRNCNDEQWYKTDTLFLYNGSVLSDWWTRERNPSINYNPTTNEITYQFCANGERNAVPTTETDRLYNPLAKRCQSINKIAEVMATANNVDGFNPLPADVLDSILVNVTAPPKTGITPRSITIYVPIICLLNIEGGFVQGSYSFGWVFGGPDTFVWGANNVNNETYAQYFPTSTQSGFVGYLNGGNLAISTQVYINDPTQGYNSDNIVDDPEYNAKSLGKLAFQKFVFTDVRPGTYIFRLASHLCNPSNVGQQVLPGKGGTFNSLYDTSTTVWGNCPLASDYNIGIDGRNSSQELLINVCDENYDTFLNNPQNEILVIASMATPDPTYCDFIYIYESLLNNYPVELIKMLGDGSKFGIDGYTSITTDFNGFGWQMSPVVGDQFPYTYLYKCIKYSFNFNISTDQIQFDKLYLDQVGNGVPSPPSGQPPIHPDFAAVQCNRILVQGYVLLESNNNIGIPGITVVISRGGTAITDDTGFYQIVAHDDVSSVSGDRMDVIVLSQGACDYKNIDGGCIPDIPIDIPACNAVECSSDPTTPRDFTVTTFGLIYTVIKSLLSGGTYGISIFAVFDWMGRCGFVQYLKNITIPTITESQTIGPSQVEVIIPPTTIFPAEFKYLTIGLTEELTIEDYITWIVDRFDLIDNSGNINPDAPTQIRIYYASLNQFNIENNFNTTTNWEFLEPLPEGQTTQQPFTSDVVNFWVNGNGTFYFNSSDAKSETVRAITALVKYDQTGQYFLIDYTTDLSGLLPNALIRLARPKNSINEVEPYYEQCNIIELENGIAQQNEIILNAFDTYYLDRQIPVPEPVSSSPVLTQTAVVSGTTTSYFTPVATPLAIEIRTFPFPFEHNSPSNFWGQGCKNIGRVSARNPYEAEDVSQNQIALSGVNSGELSYLQYFSSANKNDIQIQDTSGIVAIIYRQGVVHGITQYSKFRIGYNDNNVRVNASNQVIAPSAADAFGNPEVDLQNNYGCQLIDKCSIAEIQGIVAFVDRSKGEVLRYDFIKITSLSKDDTINEYGVMNGRCDAWFRAKVKSMNGNPMRYFTSGYDPMGPDYILTDFTIGNNSYINEERTYNPKVNETVVFNLMTGDLRGWRSFIPEMYAYLDGDILSNQVFMLKQAIPYSSYNVNENNSYNVFFGIQCSKVIEIIANQPIFKKKKFNVLSIYSKQSLWFSDKITTESGQLSYLFLSNFEQALYFSFAPLMQNVNTLSDPNNSTVINQNPLQEGDNLYGDWISIRLISDSANNNNYVELLGIDVEAYDYEKT